MLNIQVGKEALPEEEEKEFNSVMTEMGGIYGTSTVCLNGTEWSNMTNGEDTCLPLSPDLTNLMATSSDYKLRTYVWEVLFLSLIFLMRINPG